jgi:hypothetical protein
MIGAVGNVLERPRVGNEGLFFMARNDSEPRLDERRQ